MCMYEHTYVCIYLSMDLCVDMYTSPIFVYISADVYIYMYVVIYVYIY